MCDIPPFAGFAQSVTLHRLRENHGWRAFVFDRRFVGGIHFARIMPTPEQFIDLLIGQVIDELQQFGITTATNQSNTEPRCTLRRDRPSTFSNEAFANTH